MYLLGLFVYDMIKYIC